MSTTADIVATFCLMNDARNENKFHYWELLPNKSKTMGLCWGTPKRDTDSILRERERERERVHEVSGVESAVVTALSYHPSPNVANTMSDSIYTLQQTRYQTFTVKKHLIHENN